MGREEGVDQQGVERGVSYICVQLKMIMLELYRFWQVGEEDIRMWVDKS